MTSRILITRLLQRIEKNVIPYFIICSLQTSVLNGCYGASTTDFVKPLNLGKYSTNMGNNWATINIAYYDEIKDLPNHPEKLLIDVRRPEELVETGKIPTSINIPLSVVKQELSKDVNAEDFKQKYGRDQPADSTEIIFTCRSGRRAQEAAEIAVALGYKNVKNYKGSWIDWADHEGLPK